VRAGLGAAAAAAAAAAGAAQRGRRVLRLLVCLVHFQSTSQPILCAVAAANCKPNRLERPLVANVSLAYRPSLHKWMPLLQQGGLEDLTITFPAKPYAGHLKVCVCVCVCARVRLVVC
jgi:hypothetical protein